MKLILSILEKIIAKYSVLIFFPLGFLILRYKSYLDDKLMDSFSDFLGNYGNLLMGYAIYKGVNDFINEKKKKRSEAASNILGKIRRYKDRTINITDNKELFQYEEYLDKLPYSGKAEQKRPSQLINKITYDLKNDLHDEAAKLPIDAYNKLYLIVDELKKHSKILATSIYLEITNPQELASNSSYKWCREALDSNSVVLSNLTRQAEEILIPFIESGQIEQDDLLSQETMLAFFMKFTTRILSIYSKIYVKNITQYLI